MKAKESSLNELHEILAKVLSSQVGEFVLEETEEGILKIFSATPALLTVATKFLKDNEITCEIGESKDAGSLKKKLADRKKHSSRLAEVTHIDPDLEALSG